MLTALDQIANQNHLAAFKSCRSIHQYLQSNNDLASHQNIGNAKYPPLL